MSRAPEKRMARGSLLFLPILISVTTFIIGFFETNERNSTATLENFFIHENWRFGLSSVQTLLDPTIFWGEIWFNLLISIFISVIWMYHAPPGNPSTWKTSSKDNLKIFLISISMIFLVLVFMVIQLFLSPAGLPFRWQDWWPAQTAYQIPTLPIILSTIALILAPMKCIKKESGEKSPGNSKILIILLMAGLLPWLMMLLDANWHPRSLFHFEYQFHAILSTIVYPVSIFTLLATFMLSRKPRKGDGSKTIGKEIIIFFASIVPIILLQFIGVYTIGLGANTEIFDMAFFFWWPAAHLIPYVFMISVSFAIVTGTRLLVHANKNKLLKTFTRKLKLNKKIKVVIAGAFAALFILPPVVGYSTYEDDPPRVLVNQVGYLPSSTKRVLFQAPIDVDVPGSAQFSLIDESNQSTAYSGVLLKNESWYGHWYMEGNFTSYSNPGTYHVEAMVNGKKHVSPSFQIGEDVYDIILDRVVDFYYYQRCGYKVKEIVQGFMGHEACHLDDAMIFNGSNLVYKNLTGGWHDAGDYNKYNSWYHTQWHSAQSLVDAWKNLNATYLALNDQYDSSAPDILDEIMWAASYLVKCVDTEGIKNETKGMVIHNVVDWDWNNNKSAHMSYWGPPDRNTDNIPNTGDERVVYTNTPYEDYTLPWGWASQESGYGFAGAMLQIARIIENESYTFPSWAPNVTLLRDTASLLNETYYPIAEANSHTTMNWTGWPHHWSLMSRLSYEQEIGWLTGNFSTADDWAYSLFTAIGNDFDKPNDATFLATILNYYVEFNRTIPPDVLVKALSWQSTLFEDRFVGPLKVFHLLDETGDPYLFGRGIPDQIHGITNMDHFTFMWLQSLMAKIDGTDAHLDLPQATLDYILGVNPLGLCQMDGVGGQSAPQIHHRYSYVYNPSGRVPGGIINAIRRYEPSDAWAELHGVDREEAWTLLPDQAWIDNWPASGLFPDGVSAHSNEIWITHTAMLLKFLPLYLRYHC